MLTPGQDIIFTIEKPAAGGRMIARVDGQVVLVAGAIPGERVRARIERVTKGMAFADAVDIETPSPDRRTADDPLCGGCLYAHIAYDRQLIIKSEVVDDAFRRIGRTALPAPLRVAASPESGYRMRARLHVRGGQIGFFREGTHAVCAARRTEQLLPETCDVIERLAEGARIHGLDGIREIELSENADTSQRVVALDAESRLDGRAVAQLARIEGLTGLVSAAGSFGSPFVVDRVEIGAGHSIAPRRHVLAFFQGNRFLLSDFVAHVLAQVSAAHVLDLYAGVGLFALGAARRSAVVTAVEGDRVAAADLAANASAVDGLAAIHQSVEDFLRGESPSRRVAQDATVIVDPPRTGLSKEALDGILALRAPRVVYVSCDPATLARDARRLVESDYAITGAEGFDLFPNTPHIETVVVFDRR